MRRVAISLLFGLAVGCSNSSMLSISGELTFQGVAVPGEITFEPLDSSGKSVGRALSIAVPASGSFSASLPAKAAESQPYRLTVRVAPPAATDAEAAAINPNPFGSGVKTVPLLRELKHGQKLVLAITQ